MALLLPANAIIGQLKKVPQATSVLIDSSGHIKTSKYSSIATDSSIFLMDESTTIKTIESKLITSLQNILSDNDEVDLMLSGGLDSALILGLLQKIGCNKINTHSIGYPDKHGIIGNEFFNSDLLSASYNTNHNKIIATESDIIDNLDNAFLLMDEPMVTDDIISFYLMFDSLRSSGGRVITGHGADELFGGYFWYQKMSLMPGTDIDKMYNSYVDRPYDDFTKTVNSKYVSGDLTKKWMLNQLKKSSHNDFINKILKMDITKIISDDPIKRVNNMSKTSNTIPVYPFMDWDLISFVSQIPSQYKLKNNGKFHLKKIAEKILPREIYMMPKATSGVPILSIIDGEILDFCQDTLRSTTCKNRNVFNNQYLEKILEAPEKYRTSLDGSRLWQLASLERWFQLNVD